MAKNILQGGLNLPVTRLSFAVTDPASPKSGDPCRFGTKVVGVAEGDMDAGTSLTTMNIDCVASLSVKAVDGAGNSAVTAGDLLYYMDADTPKLSKKNTGVPFGIAYGNDLTDGGLDTRTGTLIAAGSTANIRVLVKVGLST